MANSHLIGIVTVTYNSESVLRDFLQCMAQQTHKRFLLFAVDNASTDNTLRILRESTDERMRIIANSDNRGVAAGNNQGVRAALEAGCDAVLLMNNDTEFGPKLFSKLDEGISAGGAEMTCPKMMYFDEPQRIWAAGGAFQPYFGYRAVHLGADQIDHGQYDRACLVTYAPTCCVLVKKEVFQKIGLMDERYFVYMDDVDFMFRAMKAGIQLMYLPEEKLLHKVGRLTGGGDSPFSHRYCTRNRVYFLLRHFGAILSAPLLVLYQLYFMAAFLCRKFSFETYRIKEQAVIEALMMWKAHSFSKAEGFFLKADGR